jgi:HTH-type transcriptional regulator, sugar sensing transcriptional regulator
MSTLSSLIQSLGLTAQEGKVYLAALELGESTMQELSRKAKVKRTTLYHFIDGLVTRQFLVEMRRSKRKIYSAVAPEHLLEVAKTRTWELERTLPLLKAVHNRSSHKPRVTFHEGIDGIKEVYSDMLTTRAPIVGWSDYKHMWPTLGIEYCTYFPQERAKRGIPFHSIVSDSPESRKIAASDPKVLRQTKFIRTNDLKTEINIYGHKILLASFRSTPAFAVLIEDADIAETMRMTWKELWNKL